jgi:hypothetical protein
MKNMTNLFKLLDSNGVMFNFRMLGYKKFRSKTGAIITILCIYICLMISYFEILDFVNGMNFTQKIYDKKKKNDSINLKNQNFTFAISLPNIPTGENSSENFWIVEAFYKYSDKIRENGKRNYSINATLTEKKCNLSDFDTEKEKKDFAKNLNLRCFDAGNGNANETQKIMGEYFSKKFSYVEVTLSTKKKYLKDELFDNNKLKFDIFYPTNLIKKPSQYSSIGKSITSMYSILPQDQILRLNIFLQKKVYIEDLGLIFPNIKKYTYTNLQKVDKEIYNLEYKEKNDDDIIILSEIFFREGGDQKRYEKSRMKLNKLLKSIISNFINILIITRFFMEMTNLIKAKKEIIQSCIIIDEEENDKVNLRNLRIFCIENKNSNNNKIKKVKNDNDNYNDNNNDSDNNLNDKVNNDNNDDKINSNRIILSNSLNLEQMMIEKETMNKSFVEKNLNKSFEYELEEYAEDTENENEKKKENSKKKTSLIKTKTKTNLKTLIWSYITCNYNQSKKISNIYNFTIDRFNNYLYINAFIRRMEEIETIKKFLFENGDDKRIFNQLSVPIIKSRNKNISEEKENLLKIKKDKDEAFLLGYYKTNLYNENKTKEEINLSRMIEDYFR